MCFGGSNKFLQVSVEVGDQVRIEILAEEMCYISLAGGAAREMFHIPPRCAPPMTPLWLLTAFCDVQKLCTALWDVSLCPMCWQNAFLRVDTHICSHIHALLEVAHNLRNAGLEILPSTEQSFLRVVCMVGGNSRCVEIFSIWHRGHRGGGCQTCLRHLDICNRMVLRIVKSSLSTSRRSGS